MKSHPSARASWAALAVDRFVGDDRLSEFVGVFMRFDPRDESGMWAWLADAPERSVIAWCRRMERAGWRMPKSPDPKRDLPWSLDGRGGAGERRR